MARSYEVSHPWITFSANRLERASPRLWTLIGECQSKCEHIAGIPLRPDVAERLHRIYLAKGALATTAIEGNTLTEDEALKAVAGKLQVPPSREYLAQEIENILEAYREIWAQVKEGKLNPLRADNISHLNAQVLKGLAIEENVIPGTLRTYSVGVARYRGAPAEDCEYLLNRLGDWLQSPELAGGLGVGMVSGIIRAILAHLYLAWIHPFGDGNGRTARLVEYQILLACGVPSPAIHLLSNHYNLTRTEYYRQLERSSASGGDYIPFIEYAVQGFTDGLRKQIQEIREFQLEVIWRNYVHEAFGEKKSNADRRRRDLVLALSGLEQPVRLAKIPGISPRMTEAYQGNVRMKLNRDLNILQGMGLIVRGPNGTRANKEIVEAFLPFRTTHG
jgi:Fic family protein